MPVIRKKPVFWTCRTCNARFSNEDKEVLKEQGFQHQVDAHDLVPENKDWFMNHMGNYYILA